MSTSKDPRPKSELLLLCGAIRGGFGPGLGAALGLLLVPKRRIRLLELIRCGQDADVHDVVGLLGTTRVGRVAGAWGLRTTECVCVCAGWFGGILVTSIH